MVDGLVCRVSLGLDAKVLNDDVDDDVDDDGNGFNEVQWGCDRVIIIITIEGWYSRGRHGF